MGKKVNFYLVKEDWTKIIKYFTKSGFLFLDQNSEEAQPKVVQNLEIGNFKKYYLVLSKQLAQVKTIFLTNKNYFYIDNFSSPVIEINTGFFNEKYVYQGRFYYHADYHEQDQFLPKNAEFLKSAQNLFRWFKRNFDREESQGWGYIGDFAKKLEIGIPVNIKPDLV